MQAGARMLPAQAGEFLVGLRSTAFWKRISNVRRLIGRRAIISLIPLMRPNCARIQRRVRRTSTSSMKKRSVEARATTCRGVMRTCTWLAGCFPVRMAASSKASASQPIWRQSGCTLVKGVQHLRLHNIVVHADDGDIIWNLPFGETGIVDDHERKAVVLGEDPDRSGQSLEGDIYLTRFILKNSTGTPSS